MTGRGSLSRYRAAVVDAIEEWDNHAGTHDEIAADLRRSGLDEEAADNARWSRAYTRAADRARRILAALDGAR